MSFFLCAAFVLSAAAAAPPEAECLWYDDDVGDPAAVEWREDADPDAEAEASEHVGDVCGVLMFVTWAEATARGWADWSWWSALWLIAGVRARSELAGADEAAPVGAEAGHGPPAGQRSDWLPMAAEGAPNRKSISALWFCS